ncbi:MAG: hypothetical protein ABJN36_08075 [Cyclobacteriaceae bacterium]
MHNPIYLLFENFSYSELLEENSEGLKKGKRHQVFRLSFDAKKLEGDAVERVLDYIHHNLVSGIWNLVDDFTDYPYSSAGYYDCEKQSYYTIVYFREV